MLEGLTLPGVARLPVEISGAWTPGAKRDWRGAAAASAPVVAVTFLRHGDQIDWCISERPRDNRLELRLALFPYDRSGLDIQVNCSLGRAGRVQRARLASAAYLPKMPLRLQVQTGEVYSLARIDGSPAVDFLALFLALGDTETGRKGIWHLRPALLAGAPPMLAPVLAHGRTGTFADPMG